MMRIAIPVFLVSLFLLHGAPAEAAGSTHTRPGLFKIAGGDPIPSEWAGVWTVIDSFYNCSGVLQDVYISTDTLCSSEVFVSDSTFAYDCTGTATATTVNMTCTGSDEIFTDCTANFNTTIVGTRTLETYSFVVTSNVTFSGTGKGCDLIPPSCTQFNSHGIRIAPEPTAYCATPVRETTWGRVKSQYR